MSSDISFETLFNFAPDAYFILDLKGNIVDGNHAAETLLGYKKAELVGKNITKLSLIPLNQMPVAVARMAVFAAGEIQGGIKLTLLRKDKSKVNVEIFTTFIKLDKKKLALNIARDLTERRKSEIESKMHQRNLEKLVKERTVELEKSNADLRDRNKRLLYYNELFVGREFRIKELRDKVKELEDKLSNK